MSNIDFMLSCFFAAAAAAVFVCFLGGGLVAWRRQLAVPDVTGVADVWRFHWESELVKLNEDMEVRRRRRRWRRRETACKEALNFSRAVYWHTKPIYQYILLVGEGNTRVAYFLFSYILYICFCWRRRGSSPPEGLSIFLAPFFHNHQKIYSCTEKTVYM